MRAVSAAAAAAAVVQHAPKRHGQPRRQQRQHGPFQPAHASGDQQQELIQPRRNAPGYNALEPVSYTHLDVYKRQELEAAKTKLAGEQPEDEAEPEAKPATEPESERCV